MCLYDAQISGQRLQDRWSSSLKGLCVFLLSDNTYILLFYKRKTHKIYVSFYPEVVAFGFIGNKLLTQ